MRSLSRADGRGLELLTGEQNSSSRLTRAEGEYSAKLLAADLVVEVREPNMPVEDLRQSPMMAHLMDSLDRGEDIGHYGRLVMIMVGRHFMSEDELLGQLVKDKDCDEEKARSMIAQVSAKDYNPPKRERILEWMEQQNFPICEDTGDRNSCNVYKDLKFPPEIYEKISSYYQDKN